MIHILLNFPQGPVAISQAPGSWRKGSAQTFWGLLDQGCLSSRWSQNLDIMVLLLVCWLLSHVPLFATPGTVATRLLCPWNFPGKDTRAGRLSFPPPGDLPNSRIEPVSLVSPALANGFFTTALPGKPSLALRVGLLEARRCLVYRAWHTFIIGNLFMEVEVNKIDIRKFVTEKKMLKSIRE